MLFCYVDFFVDSDLLAGAHRAANPGHYVPDNSRGHRNIRFDALYDTVPSSIFRAPEHNCGLLEREAL